MEIFGRKQQRLQFLKILQQLTTLSLSYGGPGLGKTHLLNAIGNQILENIPNARVKYVPAETFINEFLEHLRLGEMKTFKEYLSKS